MNHVIEFIGNPRNVTIACTVYIVFYYILSFFGIKDTRNGKGYFKKNSFIDHVTSALWILVAITFIWSLVLTTIKQPLSLGLTYLLIYYFLFIFLFAFLYGIIEWHIPGSLKFENKIMKSTTWNAELQYVLFSVQTITTFGYNRTKPAKNLIEVIAAFQALLGLFFTIIFISTVASTVIIGK